MSAFKHRRTLLSALLVSSLGMGLLTGCDDTPDVIKIGVAQPLTGKKSPQGIDLLNGVKMAADELNKTGIKVKGKKVKIEIVAVDDQANAETGKIVAQQLVDAGVVAVIGHFNSGVSIAAAPIYAAKDIPQLSTSTNAKYTALGLSTTFRLVANDTMQAKAIGSFAANNLNATRFAVVDDSTPYGKDLAAGAATQLDLYKKEIVFKQSFDNTTTAFEGLAQKLKDGNIDVIVTTMSDFQVLALLENLKKIDYTRISVLGGDTIKTTAMLKGLGMVAGIYASSPVLEALEFQTGSTFLDKYRAIYKVDPAYAGYYTYDAMYAIADAIGRAGSVKPKDIGTMLRKSDPYVPVTNSFKFDEKGDQRYGAVSVYNMATGKWLSQVRSDTW